MQMLQQLLGEQGARYAAFLLTAITLLVAILLIWILIRKALGSRLNFSDKPDRRGRPPRLGITESFNVDRDGRRLVIIRRDNFEHLVMIGGLNDVLIETNIIRGERLGGGRNDQRTNEVDQNVSLNTPLPRAIVETPHAAAPSTPPAPPAQAPVTPPKPVMRPPIPSAPPPAPAAPKAAPEMRVPEPNVVLPNPPGPIIPTPAVPAAPVLEPFKADVPAAPLAEARKVSLPSARSVADKARDIARAMIPEATKEAHVIPAEPILAKAKPSLTERLKSGLSFGGKSSKQAAPEAPIEAVKIPGIESFAKPDPLPPASAAPKLDSFRSEMEQLTKTAAKPVIPEVLPEVAKVTAPVEKFMPAPPPASAVVPPPRPAPEVPASPKPEPLLAAKPAPVSIKPPEVKPPAPKPVSKNPFDSLEDEMAKLLGRAPEGKG